MTEALYARVRTQAEQLHLSQTLRVLPLARQWHAGQYRKGEERLPYISHPLSMACHALSLGLADDDLLSALLLHDVVEDCGISAEDLPVNQRVRRAVSLVTFCRLDGETYSEAKARYYGAIAEDPLARMVKVIDRCHNISCMASGFTRERMASYVRETDEYILPLLDALGSGNAAWALRYQLESLLNVYRRLL